MFRPIFERTRPFTLILSVLAYLLGAGVARYLGRFTDLAQFWLGLAWVLFLPAGGNLLVEYFRGPFDPLMDDETPRQRLEFRNRLLVVAGALLASAGVAALLILRINPSGIVIGMLAASLVLAGLYSVPPARLAYSGFGELVLTVLAADLPVVLAFFLQAGEFHRLLYIVTLPLTTMMLASLIVLDFPTFAADRKYGRLTLLVRMGWERAIPLTDGLILGTYMVLAAAIFLGIPSGLLWPSLLTLPFAALQVWWLRAVAAGEPPFWKGLKANAYGLSVLLAYLLAFAFWSR
jgi:1,4-dihydroxy-2-naphthoate octaprenyltransferase